ncbi:MAG: hypothetical protein ACYSTG_11330, partial [Planctomycetota bacterium]
KLGSRRTISGSEPSHKRILSFFQMLPTPAGVSPLAYMMCIIGLLFRYLCFFSMGGLEQGVFSWPDAPVAQ